MGSPARQSKRSRDCCDAPFLCECSSGDDDIAPGRNPEVARALVELDLGLDGLVVRGTLQSGIVFAMGRG